MWLNRRNLLMGGAALAASCCLPLRVAHAAAAATDARKIALYNTHTGEHLKAAYWENGEYVPEALTAINYHLRDFRSGDIYPIDPLLLDMLFLAHYEVGSNKPFAVISGYRSPTTNAMLAEHSGGVARGSLHMEGRAIDVRLADREVSDLYKVALDMKVGGVGYYGASNFVHIDTGRVRTWGWRG